MHPRIHRMRNSETVKRMNFIAYLFSKSKILWTLAMGTVWGFYSYCAITNPGYYFEYVDTFSVWIIGLLLTGIVIGYLSNAHDEFTSQNKQ